ncbi:MAG: YDG domain-containing protein, partial [Polaromonas sp.]
NINAPITATRGNLVVCCGRDIKVNAAISVTDGSVLMAAGRNVDQNAAITMARGNLEMCAANDVNVNAKITMTNGNAIVTRSLGLPLGLTLIADTDGTGPGVAGGTVNMNVSGASRPSVTGTAGTAAPVTIHYNPVSYAAPTDYLPKFILVDSALTQRMLVFPEATKTFDGTTSAVLASLKGNPAGVSLVANPGSTAVFSSADPGTGKTVTFTGYSLTGPDAAQYALATSCCEPIVSKTTGTITASLPYSALYSSSLSSSSLPSSGATVLAMAGVDQFPSDLMPTPYAANDDVFVALAEEKEVAPTAIPFQPPPPYVAPRYAPKQERN